MTAPHSPPEPSPSPTYHVIIIGAGWYGLAAAKTYLQLHPSISLLLLDAETHVGGVWSRSRVYPRLIINQPTPMFEYPDLSMKEELGLPDWSDITGDMVAEYLEIYAKKFGVLERCRLSTEVVGVEREGENGRWIVHVRPAGVESKVADEELRCEKLMLATGHNSKPKFPNNLDTSMYTGRIFHVKEIGKRFYDLIKEDDVKTVAVVGGNKSAFELAGMFALEGKKVNWLIREEGAGPGLLMKDRPDGKTHAMKGKTMRAPMALVPSLYHSERWITRFLHSRRYWLCNWFIDWFWKAILKGALDNYNTPNRKLIKPLADSLFWPPAGLASYHCHDEAVFDLIDEGTLLTITRTAIASLKSRNLTLFNGSTIQIDAVIFATGWELSHPTLFPTSLTPDLCLPIAKTAEPAAYKSHWAPLDQVAEARVLALYPILRHPPANLHLERKPARATTPARHFRFLVPPSLAARGDRSVVFLGNIHVGELATHAMLSALWSVAYLEDMFPRRASGPRADERPVVEVLGDVDAMEQDVAAVNAYFKLRYLDLLDITLSVFEQREVIDRLLLDLGLRPDRKGMRVDPGWWGWRAWMKEWFEPYSPRDYSGVMEEFLESRKGL